MFTGESNITYRYRKVLQIPADAEKDWQSPGIRALRTILQPAKKGPRDGRLPVSPFTIDRADVSRLGRTSRGLADFGRLVACADPQVEHYAGPSRERGEQLSRCAC